MGANFINTCLEEIAKTLESTSKLYTDFISKNTFPEIVMSILSNYVHECLVKAQVRCPVEEMSTNGMDGKEINVLIIGLLLNMREKATISLLPRLCIQVHTK